MPSGAKKRKAAAAKKKKGSGSHSNNNNNNNNQKNNNQQPQIHGDEDLKHHDGKESEGEDGGSPSSHHQHQSTDEEKEDVGRADDSTQGQSIAVENKSAEETKENGASVTSEVLDNSIASEELLKDVDPQKESDNGVLSQPVNEEAIIPIETKSEPSEKLDEISAVQSIEHGTDSSDNVIVESHVKDNMNVVLDNSPFASSTEAANMLPEGLTQVANTVPVEETHGSLVESGVGIVSDYSGPGQEQVSIDNVTSGDSFVPIKGGSDENGKKEADASELKDKSSLTFTLEDPGFADDNDESGVATNAAVVVPDAKSSATQENKEVFISGISRREEVANVGTVNSGDDSIKNLEVNESSVNQPLLGHAAQPVQKTSWTSCCGLTEERFCILLYPWVRFKLVMLQILMFGYVALYVERAQRVVPLDAEKRVTEPALEDLKLVVLTFSVVDRNRSTQELIETNQTESGFVDIGYICSVHGLQGEVRVKPITDFPELRFAQPGRRWLRQQVSGREIIKEIQLVEGRGHQGQQSWIVRFNEIDTVDEALKLVGSTVMVSEQDRPELDEGEFYTHDLIGMRVILKETGESLGTVVSVFNSGASDLLRVKLDSSGGKPGKPRQEVGNNGPLVWIPFVEAIVPDVDVTKREMQITPPDGLLELNIRSDERSKKERRQLEWKERKKFQKRVIAAKKKLCELEQQHVFNGFGHGEKSQARLLAEQIVTVNSKLLQQALQMHTVSSTDAKKALRVVDKCFNTNIKKQSDLYCELQEKGFSLTSHGKVATILVFEGNEEPGVFSEHSSTDPDRSDAVSSTEELLSENEILVKADVRPFVPLILVSPANVLTSLQEMFINHEYFSLDSDKVWFLEEERLPVVSNSVGEPKRHKILMKSPWEILQTPVGSGGIISLLASNKLLDDLSTLGVEYVKVCKNRFRSENGDALVGLVASTKSNVGIEVCKDLDESEEDLHMVFAIKFMKKLVNQMSKVHFEAIPTANSYTEKVEKAWIDMVPTSPNSLEFRSSIFSFLKSCRSNEISVLRVDE
ncbi:OLC1v1022089C1 [Oldenlandia corymbosa var. corymbosa]|uniref:OLC1v1022089C1 n=1 Tax=Oldenlandia corymbosa var. corymbosa TaxID=529605 RepID=A0AAV1BZW1_OLDCO|nr:OLC1v1022089C1 [Oldenlandia corymbosa var. corymbosa]